MQPAASQKRPSGCRADAVLLCGRGQEGGLRPRDCSMRPKLSPASSGLLWLLCVVDAALFGIFSSRLGWILRRDLAVWSCSCDALRHLGRPLPGPGLAGPKPSQPAGMRPRLRSNFRVAPVRSTPRTADDTTQQSRGFEQTRQSVTVYGYCCVFSRAAVNINGGHVRHLPPHCTTLRLGAICLVCRPKCAAGGNGPLASCCGGCAGGGRILALHMPVSALCARSSVWSAPTDPFLMTASLVGGRISCVLACRRPPPKIPGLWQCQSSDGRSASFEFGVASKKISNFHVLRRSLKDAEDLAESAGVAQGSPGASPGCSGANYSN